jgi:hypothetical protein
MTRKPFIITADSYNPKAKRVRLLPLPQRLPMSYKRSSRRGGPANPRVVGDRDLQHRSQEGQYRQQPDQSRADAQ